VNARYSRTDSNRATGPRSIFLPLGSRSSPPFRRRVSRQYGGSVKSSWARSPESTRA
jgi:hypothetical protein